MGYSKGYAAGIAREPQTWTELDRWPGKGTEAGAGALAAILDRPLAESPAPLVPNMLPV